MSKKEIFEQLRSLALCLNTPVEHEVLKAYTEALHEYGLESIKMACKRLLATSEYFPKPKHFIELINGNMQRLDADYFAGEIIEAIKTYGWCNLDDAKNHLGNELWEAVLRFGGWNQLCQIQNSEMGIVRAQLRDLLLANSNADKIKANKTTRIDSKGLQKISFN